jgi:hypothetical protein
MKKTKSTAPALLPTDFSTVEEPVIESPKLETEKIDLAPLPVPEVDHDAELKIDEVQMQSEELPEQEKRGKSLFILGSIIAVVILAGVIVLSYLYIKNSEQKAVVTQPSPTPTAIVSQSPQPKLIKANFKFEILNASGVSGQAGKTQTIVEGLGYTVSSIGNANSRETETKLLLKSDLVDQKDLVLTDLQKTIPGIVYAGVFDSETATARIILGE